MKEVFQKDNFKIFLENFLHFIFCSLIKKHEEIQHSTFKILSAIFPLIFVYKLIKFFFKNCIFYTKLITFIFKIRSALENFNRLSQISKKKSIIKLMMKFWRILKKKYYIKSTKMHFTLQVFLILFVYRRTTLLIPF